MALELRELAGMSDDLLKQLKDADIQDAAGLLAACGTRSARTKLAETLGIDQRRLLELANRADLSRVKGIGRVYSDLLELSGVDTVMELRQRNPDNLHEAMLQAAKENDFARTPRNDQVHRWVNQAKNLERAISY